MKSLKFTLAENAASYDIHIGADVRENLGPILRELEVAQRFAIITDDRVAGLYGETLREELSKAGLSAELIAFPAGEGSKNIETVLFLVRKLLAASLDRKSALIALGGGVVGDVVGFVASLYMRSLPYVQIPTTLLAQVDSSIGGKTAIDLDEGKNLLGTFYQPRAVFTDPRFLETLPEEEFASGLAEVVKYGIIAGGELFGLLEKKMAALKAGQRDVLGPVIERCCTIKKELVEIDEKDQGPRRFLNFGHTLGHALEAASAYRLSHGKGVAIGMMAASRLAEKVCGLPPADRLRIERLIKEAGLPTAIPGDMNTDLIMTKLQSDKKKSGQTVNFVLLQNIGAPLVTGAASEALVRQTVEELKS